MGASTHAVRLNGVRVAIQGGLSLGFGLAVNLILVTVVLGGTAWLLAWLYLASGRLIPWDGNLPYSINGQIAPDWEWTTRVWVVPALGVTAFLLEKAGDRYVTTLPPTIQRPLRLASSWLVIGGAGLAVAVTIVPWLIAEAGSYAAGSDSLYAGLLYQLGFVPSEVCQAAIEAGQAACGVEAAQIPGTPPPAAPATVPGVSLVTIVASVLAVLASARSAGTPEKQGSGLVGFIGTVWAKIKDPSRRGSP